MHERLRWDPATQPPSPSTIIVDAPRLIGALAIAAAVVGAALKWARPAGADDPREYVPLYSSDAALLVGVALVGIPLLLFRSVAESRTRTIQAGLVVVGVLGLSQWLTAAVRLRVLTGSSTDPWVTWNDLGPILTGIGTTTFFRVSALLSARMWRRNGVADDPAEVTVSSRGAARAGVQVVAAVVGFALGLVVLLNTTLPAPFEAAAIIAFVVGPIFTGGLGMWIGERLARRLLPDTPRDGEQRARWR